MKVYRTEEGSVIVANTEYPLNSIRIDAGNTANERVLVYQSSRQTIKLDQVEDADGNKPENPVAYIRSQVFHKGGDTGEGVTQQELDERLGGATIWKGTQAQYDAIEPKDPNTIYHVI